ncbi:hypothetical protein QMA10_13535 [Arthrobacter sp. APC 3897]|uniref:hypothetical protein n=1 Tax=Arthrobacter sp. APC 3897 TaxID=3035204 RepID=UPI0025B56CE7|nr:hypothetical protein [Arthrobacter sp. APC 3897]MDN3482944.1 hypothetical protein [Arthrobacter sp. APC 3897]
MLIGITGLVVTTAQPGSEVRIVVEGRQPWNISQGTVEASLDEPVASWQPLTLVVTDRTLSLEEQQGNLAPGTDILLSTRLPEPSRERAPYDTVRQIQAVGKVGIRPVFDDPDRNLVAGQDIHDAYQTNVGLGHGPLAVVAAAQEASLQLSDRSDQSFWPWLLGTVLGLLLTAFAMSKALKRRSLWEARFRRLTAAQRRLAGVVLDLEALEATYRTVDPEQRPPGFTEAWTKVRDASLELARTEKEVAAAVRGRSSGMTARTAQKVEKFETGVSDLVAAADAVMGAGAVIGGFGSGETTFQRLGAPLAFAARELLTRLRAAPAGAVEPQMITSLESALDSLLEAGAGTAGGPGPAVHTWERAERGLKRQAQTLSRKLRHMLPRRRLRRMPAQPVVAPRPAEDLSVLRTSLGLAPQGSRRSLDALDAANAMAREVFGRLPEFDDAQDEARGKAPVNPKLRKRIGLGAKVLAGFAAAFIALLLSLTAMFAIDDASGTLPTGNRPLEALRFEPDGSKFDLEEIRRNVGDTFMEDLAVTVVAGRAEDDLLISMDYEVNARKYDPQDPMASSRVDANLLLETMWKLKAQYPHLVDESTGELLPGHALVPVYFFDNGYTTVPAWMTSEVYYADARRMGRFNWDTSEFFISKPEEAVSESLEQMAKAQQWNGYTWQIRDSDPLLLLLFPIMGIVLFIGYQVLRYGGSMSMRLGRFGRDAARLRTVRRDLETLTMGLDDSRLNAVFMADQGSAPLAADGDQRLFESALAVAWRMAEELASRPLAQRLGPDYRDQIRRLEYLVSVLSVRDMDVAGRAQALLDADRGA